MAFLNLRNNHLIYILHKDLIPSLETGVVTNVSMPVPKYGTNMYGEMIIDVTADVNGVSTNFLKLPANGEIADFGKDIIVSSSKDAMNHEVESMKKRSLDIINSIDYHKDIVKGCEEVILLLNPEIAEKLKLEKENKELREELNSLKLMFLEFLNQMK